MDNKRKKTIRRRFVTLIEMMIVMFLIALITGVVAYNYRGSLDEGKAFKTKAGMERLSTILNLAAAEDSNADLSGNGWQAYVKASPLVQDANALINDGWGQPYKVTVDQDGITIWSDNYSAYKQKNQKTMFK